MPLPPPSRTGLWSSLALLALSAAGGAQVVINEIFYAPPDKTKAVEFIELFNPGDKPVDLSRWRFTSGVKFSFGENSTIPAQGYVCVAADPVAFQREFKFAPLGPWKGKLKNDGEFIQLVDAAGSKVDEVKYGISYPWPGDAHGKGRSLELINPALVRSLAVSWHAGGPTPGAVNSDEQANPPPGIGAVTHFPLAPKPGQPVTLSAKVTDLDGLKTVMAAYQLVEPGAYIRRSDEAFEKNWIELPMHDDGRDGDLKAGDGIFSAMLPPELAVHRRLVRYRVWAEDSRGARSRAPIEGDSLNNFAFFVSGGFPAWTGARDPGKTPPLTFDAAFLTTLPTFQLIAAKDDVEHSQWDGAWNHRKCTGTLIYEGKVYDHITFNNRGHASTYNTGKNKWGFHLAPGQELEMHDPSGRRIHQKWDSFSMNACASPWVRAHRGMAGLDEWFSSRIFGLLGVPSPRYVPLQFRVIDGREEAPANNQYGGDLWGLYLAIEDAGGSFLSERALGDGNIYSPESGKKERQAATQPKDRSDFDLLMNGSRHSQPEAWWRQHLDIGALASFRAANRITGNVDLREDANHFMYHAPDDHWVPIAWDLDMMIVPRTHQSGRIDQERAFDVPALAIEYANRCREALDLLLSDTSPGGGQVGQVVDEFASMIHPPGAFHSWAELDAALWDRHPRSGDKGGFYANPVHADFSGGSYERRLVTPDFSGMCRYVLDYASDSRPPGSVPWKLNDGDPRGYGFGYIKADAEDDKAPARPSLSYTGPAGFPVNALTFSCAPLREAQGPQAFAAMQWRLGQIAGPGVPGWEAGQPRHYEIEPCWTSEELPTFSPTLTLPAKTARPGVSYRARVRIKDSTGRWSRWSEPVNFVAGRSGKP